MSNSAYCLFGAPFGVLSGPALKILQVVGERTSSSFNAVYVGGEIFLHSGHSSSPQPLKAHLSRPVGEQSAEPKFAEPKFSSVCILETRCLPKERQHLSAYRQRAS